jgi:hypothetical protein
VLKYAIVKSRSKSIAARQDDELAVACISGPAGVFRQAKRHAKSRRQSFSAYVIRLIEFDIFGANMNAAAEEGAAKRRG